MPRDPRHDILFEPLRLGPVTAPNRFYQVPHCTGMGYEQPAVLAAMRGIKAEGGWGVVNTEYCSIDPTSDDRPFPYASLWDEGDVANLGRMAEAVHAHGSLVGVELWHGGRRSPNLQSREGQMAPSSQMVYDEPWQTRAMDLADIRALRASHKAAALRAMRAGFDIVYVYAAHTYLLNQFLNTITNPRRDEYGGPWRNRLRLTREILEETREAVGHKCAIAIRIEVDAEEAPGGDLMGERREMLEAICHLPDLFDVTTVDYGHEMGPSRFVKEASLEPLVGHVRRITGKPVVSVGRFTSPDTMAGQIRRGVLDLIGAARPSIADPFLPAKIREGRLEDIRECIGCNVCYAGNARGVPIRCTQNPAMGEEWRRGWHPERIAPAARPETVLVVGAGPAGLEAAQALGKRGHKVLLAEATGELGGRVSRESRLPGLAEWARVRDWRVGQLQRLANVEIFRGSAMTAEDVRAAGATHVLLATGSRWRADGQGRHHHGPAPGFAGPAVLTPDDIMDGRRGEGPVVVFDDEHYYMASLMAELLAGEGRRVTYVASSATVAAWTANTYEQAPIWRRLADLGVGLMLSTCVAALESSEARLVEVFTGRESRLACGTLVPVTSREPSDGLWHELSRDTEANIRAGIASIRRIGDCLAPGLIAQAVHDGHRAARELGESPAETRRDRVVLAAQ